MIELQDVSYHYQNNSAQGICALDHITCHLDLGRCYCLQGPNGCGKSTLFRILNGLSFPTSGHYIFNGMEITEKAMRKPDFSKDFHKQVGFVFQHSEIQLFCKTVEEEIAFGLQQLRLPDSEIEARVERYIQLLHLENIRQRAPFNLSGGEQKRCALAAVLAMDPKVLILDEPISGLDEEGQEWVTSFIRELKSPDRMMIIATHQSSFAEEVADVRLQMTKEHRMTISD